AKQHKKKLLLLLLHKHNNNLLMDQITISHILKRFPIYIHTHITVITARNIVAMVMSTPSTTLTLTCITTTTTTTATIPSLLRWKVSSAESFLRCVPRFHRQRERNYLKKLCVRIFIYYYYKNMS